MVTSANMNLPGFFVEDGVNKSSNRKGNGDEGDRTKVVQEEVQSKTRNIQK